MTDGRRQAGYLLRLDPAASTLDFHPERASSNLTIGFASVKSVRLTSPVELKKVHIPAASSLKVQPTPEKQKCVVRFKDGDCLISETVGFVPQNFGLFLFLVSYGNHVVRTFIPTEAIENYQIGDQLGKMLVDEKILSPDLIDAGLKKQEELRSRKLGDYLRKNQIVTHQQVKSALQSQRTMPQIRLGDALIQEKAITEQQLSEALQMQAKDRKMQLGEILVSMNAVTKETIRRVLAQKLGIPFVGLSNFQFDPNLIKAVPADLVRKHNVMPLYRTESRMVVAMENPLASDALQELAFYTRLKIDPVMASQEDIDGVIKQFYGVHGDRTDIAELVSELDDDTQPIPETALSKVITESDNTLVRLVNKIILDAYEQGASASISRPLKETSRPVSGSAKTALCRITPIFPTIFPTISVMRLSPASKS